jgi:xylitol oxidase
VIEGEAWWHAGDCDALAGMKNWAGNVAYSTGRVLAPRSVAEVREIVACSDLVRPLGTRHSFSRVADTSGVLLSTESLSRIVEVGERSVVVEAGIRYGRLGSVLAQHRLAVPNYASLPHISVGGAIATATHGSGVRQQSLASAVAAVDLVCADGSLIHLERTDDRFDGVVVGLGALGVVVRVTLDVVAEFDLRQQVFERLPWESVEANLDELLALGYSTSLFTRWTAAGVDQVWVKSTSPIESCFGAIPADGPRHPIAGADPAHTTDQLGVPGPSAQRLPHFRLGFTPSRGDELQSEYAVAREHGGEALRALRPLGSTLTPLLLTSEIRAVAGDSFWLSPFFGRDSVCIHFTWRPQADKVSAALRQVEAALAPFEARPHWGKLFLRPPASLYPRLAEFCALRDSLDPDRAFANAFDSQLSI